ncbi:hypothetical protein BLS_009939 [Venturia inaequalis]|uniref:Uncharacterized protein n=2 Tax=Venturia inaequalis TaxID=5025 RepID=A0A8H3Z6F5_VENIN|nr:hypothetical protein BLS_009939 [Venturia inaequalis]KAE9981341.1 hypothetical protein EG327_006246 [Venturia inaequalis]RDI88397.1 hypothetical protein Vi05172_g1434 [Venturia inaequalis]
MLRTVSRSIVSSRVPFISVRTMADTRTAAQKAHEAAQEAGQKKDTNPSNPSILSSGGAIGKQFNPDGNIGQIGEKIGGAFSKDGAIGSQFDASKDGIAGVVEKAVDGPSNPAKK